MSWLRKFHQLENEASHELMKKLDRNRLGQSPRRRRNGQDAAFRPWTSPNDALGVRITLTDAGIVSGEDHGRCFTTDRASSAVRPG